MVCGDDLGQETGWVPNPAQMDAKNLAPPRFEPWTIQPVARHYTNYAIPALPGIS
jgi:hypothetical protein